MNGRSESSLRRYLRHYYEVRMSNFRGLLDDESFPRYYKVIRRGTKISTLRLEDIKNAIEEEEQIRRVLNSYRAFCKESNDRERIKGSKTPVEDLWPN
ncbi:MAG: hypothetical protein AABY10_03660 [Nanoarchaeota archaeon]